MAGLPHLRSPRSATPSLRGSCTVNSGRTRTRPATTKPFNTSGTRCSGELKKIKLAWSGLNYSTARGVLILHPSTPAPSGWTSPANQLISPFPGLSAARQRPFRFELDSKYPPHSGVFRSRKSSIPTGLCESGKFSTTIPPTYTKQ